MFTVYKISSVSLLLDSISHCTVTFISVVISFAVFIFKSLLKNFCYFKTVEENALSWYSWIKM